MMNYTVTPDFRLLKLDNIRPNRLQPEFRTANMADSVLKSVFDDPDGDDVWIPPSVVDLPIPNDPRRFELVDGNRRIECAYQDGVPEVYCQVVKGDPARLFVDLNRGNLEFNQGTWWVVWAKSMTAKVTGALPFPSETIRDIRRMVQWNNGVESGIAKWGIALNADQHTAPHYITSPMKTIINAAKKYDDAANKAGLPAPVALTKDEIRRLMLEFIHSALDLTYRDHVRQQVNAHGLTAAKRAGWKSTDKNGKTVPPPKNTWENCGPEALRREVDRILDGSIRRGEDIDLP